MEVSRLNPADQDSQNELIVNPQNYYFRIADLMQSCLARIIF